MEFVRPESGITSTVQTTHSSYMLYDIIGDIARKKGDAVCSWLNSKKIRPERSLIIGTYMTGASVANLLSSFSNVTVFDIYPHLKYLLNHDVGFTTCYEEIESERWDFIMDTTGLGGISPEKMKKFHPDAFIVEDPCSDGSDRSILDKSQCGHLLEIFTESEAGKLFTGGLSAKTSGSMTLTLEIIKKSMREAQEKEGVLYSTSSLDFFERILFKELDPEKFQTSLKRSALIVSSLCSINCDKIIEDNLGRVSSRIIDPNGT